MPLPSIVQPVMWSYAFDCLNLSPEPDFLIMADECKDYSYRVPLEEVPPGEDVGKAKTCHVVNPGNFGADGTFTVIYPGNDSVE